MANKSRSGWCWVPSLYWAEGLPYAMVAMVSTTMFVRFGFSNSFMALVTSLLYLPWMIKPLWAPLVDLIGTKRRWIWGMQLFMGAGFVLAALGVVSGAGGWALFALLLILAFASATHDVAADGFYMLGLRESDQALYVGIRSTFYRLAMITVQGGLVILAGYMETAGASYETLQAPLSQNITHNANFQLERLQVEGTETLTEPTVEEYCKMLGVRNTLFAPNASPETYDELVPNLIVPESYALPSEDVELWQLTLKDDVATGESGRHVHFELQLADKSNGKILSSPLFSGYTGEGDQNYYILFQPAEGAKDGGALIVREVAVYRSWAMVLVTLAALMLLLCFYHQRLLPRPAVDVPMKRQAGFQEFLREFGESFQAFFVKKHIVQALAFILLYRFAEANLVKMTSPFLLSPMQKGGLGLTVAESGFLYGTVGVLCLLAGGIVGGAVISYYGLGRCIWPMALAINLPDVVYLIMALMPPEGSFKIAQVAAYIGVENFGYGLGFTAYTLFMVAYAEDSGRFKTSHMALMTGFMAMGMMLPGLLAGYIQEFLAQLWKESFSGAYQLFFIWVMVAIIPSLLVVKFLKPAYRADFGRRDRQS